MLSPGRTLRDVIDDGLPIPQLLGILAAVCDRLAEAHGHGQAHNGLTPDNIHLREDGIAILGWTKAGERPSPGAVGYLAPELAREAGHGQAGPEADLFAVGAILYECLTRRPAFAGATPLHVRLAVLSGQPTPPSDLGAPPALSDLCMALLAKQKDLRGTLLEVKGALEPFVDGAILTARSLPPSMPARAASTEPLSAMLARSLPGTPLTQVAALPIVDPGCYEIDGQIAQGGLGRIMRARDTRLGRTVAVKSLINPENNTRDRFVREAMLTARLQHPSIVPLYEAGVWPGGEPFYAMKLVSGRPLSEAFAATRNLADRLSLLPQLIAAAEAIAYAHAQRVIHRDLKPANILVGEFGETVVIDWGLAKDLAEPDGADPAAVAPYRDTGGAGALTVVGAVLGTPAYMPPEQAEGRPVDERADVYALGAILYHLLSGQSPYQGSSSKDILEKVASGPPRPLHQAEPGVPRDLLAIVDKACAREPGSRYPSARELCDDLEKFQTGQIVGAHEYTTLERLARFWRRHRIPLVIAAAALAVIVAGTAISFRRILSEQRVASARADDLALISARSLVGREPRRALAVLAGLSPRFDRWGAARILAADALAREPPLVIDGVHSAEGYGYMSADLSRDGKLLAYAGLDKIVRLLDLDSGAVKLLPGTAKRIYEVHLSPDARSLAAGVSDGTLLLWDVPCLRSRATASCLSTFTDPAGGDSGAHYPVAFSRDSQLLAWGVLREATQLISVPDKRPIAFLMPTPRGVYPHEGTRALGFSPDGTTLAATYLGGLTRLWDVGGLDRGGAKTQIVSAPRATIPETAPIIPSDTFTPDGQLVTTSDTGLTLRSPLTGAPARVHDENGSGYPVFTSDGRAFVYAGVGGTLHVRDRRSGELDVYAGQENQISALTVDPSGEHAATGATDGTVRLWDLRDGSSRWVTSHSDTVLNVMLSADGRVLASGSRDGTMHVSRIVPQEHVLLDGIDDDPRIATDYRHRPTPIALTPDGRWLAWIGRGRVVHLRAMEGGTIADLGTLSAVGLSVAVGPDGRWVAAGADDGTVRLWSARGGEARVLRGTPGQVLGLAFSPDGRSLAWGSMEGLVRLVDLDSFATRVIVAHVGWVSALTFDAAGRRLATGGGDTFIRVWDLAHPAAPPMVLRNAGISKGGNWPFRLVFADGGRLLSSRGGSAVRVWDLESGAMQEVIHQTTDSGDGALSPDASLVATGGRNNGIRIWDRRSGKVLRVLAGHSNGVRSLTWSPDGATLASGDSGGQVRLWDVATGESRILAGHGGEVVKLLFDAGGDVLVSASRDGTVRIWDDSLPRDPETLRRRIAASLEIQ